MEDTVFSPLAEFADVLAIVGTFVAIVVWLSRWEARQTKVLDAVQSAFNQLMEDRKDVVERLRQMGRESRSEHMQIMEFARSELGKHSQNPDDIRVLKDDFRRFHAAVQEVRSARKEHEQMLSDLRYIRTELARMNRN